MIYNDFLKNISQKFDNLLREISTVHNFDYGVEFEIALCKAFRVILPSNFGVARGFIIDHEGACSDWSKAWQLGNMGAYDLIKEYCN